MVKILSLMGLLAAGILLYLIQPAFADEICADCWVSDAVTEETGVYCEINKVSLFAKNFKDCTDAGGIVTRSFTPEVNIEIGNISIPNDEPEAQSTKDKQPEAP